MRQENEEKSYSGKVKTLEILNSETAKMIFRDDITAGDGAKKDNLNGKGALNARMTEILFNLLTSSGIPTHILKKEDDITFLVRPLKIFPVEVVIRNTLAGSICRRYGIPEGEELKKPLLEIFVKDDELHDPLISESVAVSLGYIEEFELGLVKAYAHRVNKVLKHNFDKAGLILVDFKLEFGRDKNGLIWLADELSGDSMRVWDKETRQKLDKDVFRKDLGDVLEGYRTLEKRLSEIEFEPLREPLNVNIIITPKEGIPNPGGNVVKRAIENFGINTQSVRLGKFIQISFQENLESRNWKEEFHKVNNELLTNPLIEVFKIQIR